MIMSLFCSKSCKDFTSHSLSILTYLPSSPHLLCSGYTSLASSWTKTPNSGSTPIAFSLSVFSVLNSGQRNRYLHGWFLHFPQVLAQISPVEVGFPAPSWSLPSLPFPDSCDSWVTFPPPLPFCSEIKLYSNVAVNIDDSLLGLKELPST